MLFLANVLHGQALSIDSLENLLKQKISDEDRVIVLNDLSFEYNQKYPTKALEYAEEALQLSKDINYMDGIRKSYGQLGSAYLAMGNSAKAIENQIKCAEYCEKLNNKAGESAVYHNIALIYDNMNRFEDAKKYISKALVIDESLDDIFSYAFTCNTYGAISIHSKDTAEAVKYFEKSYLLFVEAGSTESAAAPVKNLGIILKKQKKYDKALPYFTLAAEYYLKNDPKNSGIVIWEIADIYFLQGKNDKAIEFFEKSVEVFDLYADDDVKNKGMLKGMAIAYVKNNDFKKAYQVLSKANDLMEIHFEELDSVRTVNLDSAFADMAKKYETDKIEKQNHIQKLEIDQKEKESKIQKIMIGFSVLGLLLVTGLMVLAIRNNRRTQSANRKIKIQKTEIEKQHTIISVKNKEITSSIEYAKTLQDAILPDENHIKQHIKNHFILWLPRDIVSGDFYWFYEIDGLVFLAIADCTGHGVPGAFVSMTCHNVLNQVVIDQRIKEPGEILSRVHRMVTNVFQKEGAFSTANDGMDVVICCLNINEMKLHYAGAMNPMVHVRNGMVTELKTNRMAIGGRTSKNYQFENRTIAIEKGDWIYLYSDGFQDQFGGEMGKKYLSSKFKNLLGEISILTPSLQKEKLISNLKNWQGDFDRVDDILVVGFTI